VHTSPGAEYFFNVLFIDEVPSLANSGKVNLKMCYWSVENPHWLYQVDHQWQCVMNIWCDVINDNVSGQGFFQHDDYPTHYSLVASQVLNGQLPDR
jgi:hypothetical protein